MNFIISLFHYFISLFIESFIIKLKAEKSYSVSCLAKGISIRVWTNQTLSSILWISLLKNEKEKFFKVHKNYCTFVYYTMYAHCSHIWIYPIHNTVWAFTIQS